MIDTIEVMVVCRQQLSKSVILVPSLTWFLFILGIIFLDCKIALISLVHRNTNSL